MEVGPDSAGSDPGPACYARGGKLPTTTDANLVLGYLDEDNYAGGTIKLNRRRAERAVEEYVAKPAGLSLIDAAKAIKRKVDANMASAIFKEVAVKGYNPKHFVILSYGGGGPIHACGYAGEIGVSKVLIPPFCSVFSALGAGNMNQLHIHEKSLYLMLYDATFRTVLSDYTTFNETVVELEERGREDLIRQNVALEKIKTRVELDMRYGNQLAQISVTSPIDRLSTPHDIITLLDRFSTNYAQRFGEGSQAPEAGVRINVIRVVSYVEHDKLTLERSTASDATKPVARTERACHFPLLAEPLMTPVYDHTAVTDGMQVPGPALIETPRTTYLVERGWTLTMGLLGSAVMVKNA